MLVISRRIQESFMIGEEVIVTILGWNGNQARIGIEAPKSISIDRLEVRKRKDLERVNAAAPA